MNHNAVNSLKFRASIDFVTDTSPCFKPSSFPPSGDFAMSIDKGGNVISRFADDTWDFRTFGLKTFIRFSEYDQSNKTLFKLLVFYLIYSNLYQGKYISIGHYYHVLQKVFRVCSTHKIPADQLRRYPKLIEEIAAKSVRSNFEISVSLFHKLLTHKEYTGILIYDEKAIALHSRCNPNYEQGQHAYIPPRIWTDLIERLDEIINDFNKYKTNIENAYNYISKAYIQNKSLDNVKRNRSISPFASATPNQMVKYGANFETFAKDYGIYDWLKKYVDVDPNYDVITNKQFRAALNNTNFACYMYILFYSIMRRNEVLSLKVDCLKFEHDGRLGKIPILVGETTKTDPDSDARWIVNKRVEKAVEVAKTLVEWKKPYVAIPNNNKTLQLFQRIDVWTEDYNTLDIRAFKSAGIIFINAPKFFNTNQYIITQEDYSLALAMTPTLEREEWFRVGNIWHFGFHQFRRTLAVMFAINNVSAATGQFQMKHDTREQQFHYMNNYTKLTFNNVSSQLVITEFYNEMARNIAEVLDGYPNKISPYSKTTISNEIVKIHSEGDIRQLIKATKDGKVRFRKNLLGGCMKQGQCEYGGFDSISHCSGGHAGNMCSDLIIDGDKEQEFVDDMSYYQKKLNDFPEKSPMYASLKAEVRGYEKVLKVIKDKKEAK